jgi:hypothetical protein
LQTYFGSGAWGDLADAISTKFKGSLYPVGNAVSKLVKKDDKYPYAVSIPAKECRYIIAQPPADIRILLEKPPTASIRTEVDERSFYRWMTVCNEDAAPTSLSYQVSVTEVDSMVRVSTFSDRPATATTDRTAATPADPQTSDIPPPGPPLTLAVWVGELLGNCPGRVDIFLLCGSQVDGGVAKKQCTMRGFKDGKVVPRINVGGNRCGYFIGDLVCS